MAEVEDETMKVIGLAMKNQALYDEIEKLKNRIAELEGVTVIDTYEVCDLKDGEIFVVGMDNVIRSARRVKRQVK